MTDTRKTLLLIVAINLMVLRTITAVHSTHDFTVDLITATCEGTVGECMYSEEEEYGLDSEVHRRMMAQTTRYISYGALNRNRVPCSRRGASYYNCRPGAQANPYRRGCSVISRCRRS
ncbi:hypothetical protein vseg_008329 [Gypsophila vaccaria]